MASPLFISARLLALLLPVALLSVFFACILTCSAHSAEACEERTNVSIDVSVDLPAVAAGCEVCPATNELSCGLPGRQPLLIRNNDHPPTVWLATTANSHEFHFEARLLMSPAAHDPPLERVFVLRI
jgi:hypothetical protein